MNKAPLVRARAVLLALRVSFPAALTLAAGCGAPTALPDLSQPDGKPASVVLVPLGGAMLPGATPILGAFRNVAVGDDHACALNSAGVVYCWGDKTSLATGEPVTPPSSLAAPVPVASSKHFTATVAGQQHACALSDAGEAVCWGDNSSAQLGPSAAGTTSLPVIVPGHTFTALAAGDAFTCGLDTNQDIWCWGSNGNGTLGANFTGTTSATPLQVVGPTGTALKFTQVVAGGQHACALDTTQYAWCWGTDAVLELGHSTTQTGAPCQLGNWCAPQAQQVVGTTTSQKYYYKFSYLGAGDRRTCGIAAAGANVGYTFCWGGSFLGTSNAMLFDWDKPVSGMHTFTSFSLGPTHTCALTNTGAAWCWGRNTSGELGDGAVLSGSFPEEFDPVQVVGGHVFASITAGAGFTCAVDTAGAMWCWGQGANDQLAANQGTLALSSSPIAIASTMKFVSLAGGAMPGTGAFGCAIQRGTSTVAGPAYCWGNLIDKQLGINRSETCSGSACRTTPVPVARGLHFNALAVGTNHTCALDDAGNVSCFGANGSGELGRGNLAGAVCPFGSSACSADATAVSLGGHVMASIAAGGHHTCGIERATGAAYCWGDDSWGQLGANPQWGCGIGYCSPTPAAVATTERFQTLTGGYLFTCGLTVNNEVACWGDNSGGQLGNSATPTGATVQKVALPGTPSLVAAGADHACAQTMVYNLKVQANQYTTYCWGGNRFGQLGTGGTSTAKSPPTAANGAPGYFVALVAGVGFTCGIGTNGPPWIGVPTTGSLFCWGNGIGGGAAATLPTQIAPGVSFRSLSTRLDNVCGITSKGTTMCFGGGMHGELGTGAQTASATPVQVLGD